MKIKEFEYNKGQAVAKRQLLKALSRHDKAATGSLIAKWQPILGVEKLTNLIVNQVMIECDADSHSWFCQNFLGQSQYEQMHQKAQSNVFQILLSQGLEPGKDFSFGFDGKMIISEYAKQALLNQLPQERRTLFESQFQSFPFSDPIYAIEQQLKCPFFTNLTEIATRQIQLLSNSQAAAYLGVLLAGLVKRHPALLDVDFPTIFIFRTLQGLPQERAMVILNDQQTNPQFDEKIIFEHLLEALGDTEFNCITTEQGVISLQQLKQLDLVWYGERRISEITAVTEGQHHKNT